ATRRTIGFFTRTAVTFRPSSSRARMGTTYSRSGRSGMCPELCHDRAVTGRGRGTYSDQPMAKPSDPKPSEITPKALFYTRRGLLLAGSAALTGLAYKRLIAPSPSVRPSAPLSPEIVAPGGPTETVADKKSSYEEITNYNNFYEFSTSKYGVAEA